MPLFLKNVINCVGENTGITFFTVATETDTEQGVHFSVFKKVVLTCDIYYHSVIRLKWKF